MYTCSFLSHMHFHLLFRISHLISSISLYLSRLVHVFALQFQAHPNFNPPSAAACRTHATTWAGGGRADTLSPSPPSFLSGGTYLCRIRRRRQERYHFMSGGRGFLPFFLSLPRSDQLCEKSRVERLPALGTRLALSALSLPIHNPFQTNPAARRFIPKMAAALLLSPLGSNPTLPPPSIVPGGAKKAQGSCRVATPTQAFGAVQWSSLWRW